MRRFLVTVVGLAAPLVLAGGVGSAPAAVEVRSCAQLAPWFAVQLVGDKDAVSFGRFRATPIPKRTAAVVVWSLGGPQSAAGTLVHGWIAGTRSVLSPRCSSVRASLKPPNLSGLGPAVRVQDGWFTGRKFNCLHRGRILLEVRDISGGKRIVVRMQRGGAVVAVGEVKRGSGWVRGSKRCISAER